MEDLKPGQLVRSRAGRDKGKHYLVIEVISPRETARKWTGVTPAEEKT